MLLHWTKEAPDAERAPRFRGLLSRLSAPDQSALHSHLEVVEVTRGTRLFEVGDDHGFVYFPQGPLVSIGQGNKVEVALVGCEGLIGWPMLVGCTASPFEATVCCRDGPLLRIRAADFAMVAATRPAIGLLLSCFINAIGLQMAETIGAAVSHRLELRLARWMLLRHDRLSGDEIAVQHDSIAANLGTRRASVTDTLHLLEGAGHVRGHRGRIIVRSRPGLEQVADGRYGASEGFYRLVIGAFDKPISLGL